MALADARWFFLPFFDASRAVNKEIWLSGIRRQGERDIFS
jgi:hypothetical protein